MVYGKEPLREITTLPSLVVISIVVVETIVFVYHVTLQVPVLKGSCDFTESHHHAKFGDHKNCGSEDTFLFCHVILQDRVIKRSCYFMGGSPSR